MKLERLALDAVVIGGGVVGLAIGRSLARGGRAVAVLEREATPAAHSSSRNSEVIHAGLYYPTGSLKALSCVEGRRQLYAYCQRRGIAAHACGKLVVATCQAEEERLDAIATQGAANGVDDLQPLIARQVTAREPALTATAGLWSPSSGIIDSHGLIAALADDLSATGATLAMATVAERVTATDTGYDILCHGPDSDPFVVQASLLVNAAGLFAWDMAAACEDVATDALPPRHLAKGHYMTASGRPAFRHLVYPVPEPGGLGVHAMHDTAGGWRFGPDVTWIDGIDYSAETVNAAAFQTAIARYFPGIAERRLRPDYAGVRPKLAGPGEPPADFLLHRPDGGRAVHLFGIESPGLTACLALADRVVGLLDA